MGRPSPFVIRRNSDDAATATTPRIVLECWAAHLQISGTLKELHRLFVFFRRSLSFERTQIPSFSGFWIFLPRIQAITTRLQLSNHNFSYDAATRATSFQDVQQPFSWRDICPAYIIRSGSSCRMSTQELAGDTPALRFFFRATPIRSGKRSACSPIT